jgi:hypothetical protein
MAPDGESLEWSRVRLLESRSKYTLDKIIQDGYDNELSIF